MFGSANLRTRCKQRRNSFGSLSCSLRRLRFGRHPGSCGAHSARVIFASPAALAWRVFVLGSAAALGWPAAGFVRAGAHTRQMGVSCAASGLITRHGGSRGHRVVSAPLSAGPGRRRRRCRRGVFVITRRRRRAAWLSVKRPSSGRAAIFDRRPRAAAVRRSAPTNTAAAATSRPASAPLHCALLQMTARAIGGRCRGRLSGDAAPRSRPPPAPTGIFSGIIRRSTAVRAGSGSE